MTWKSIWMSHQLKEIVYFQCASEFSICFRMQWRDVMVAVAANSRCCASFRRTTTRNQNEMNASHEICAETRLDILLKCNKSYKNAFNDITRFLSRSLSPFVGSLSTARYSMNYSNASKVLIRVKSSDPHFPKHFRHFDTIRPYDRWWTRHHHSAARRRSNAKWNPFSKYNFFHVRIVSARVNWIHPLRLSISSNRKLKTCHAATAQVPSQK